MLLLYFYFYAFLGLDGTSVIQFIEQNISPDLLAEAATLFCAKKVACLPACISLFSSQSYEGVGVEYSLQL